MIAFIRLGNIGLLCMNPSRGVTSRTRHEHNLTQDSVA